MKAYPRTLVAMARLFGIIGKEPLRFLVYTCVNIVIGAIGILAPIAAGIYIAADSPKNALIRVLNDGNGYTLAISLLAASAAFLVNDALDRERPASAYLGIRVGAGLIGIMLLLVLTLLSGMHFLEKVIEVSNQTSGASPALAVKALKWTGQQTAQSVLLALTIVYGLWLFCLEHVDEHDDYGKDLRDSRARLVTSATEATGVSGIQV